MKKSRFTEEQIVFVLKRAELGTSEPDVCRKLGIADATFYTWRKRYGGIFPSELKHMRQLEEEKLAYKPAAPVFSDSCSLSREGAGKLEAIRILTCDSRLSASLRITP
ncbi:transposase [Citrobacter freundii]|nr:transposase [Citrobacter freundii]